MIRSVLGRLAGTEGVRAWAREQIHDLRGALATAEKRATTAGKDTKTIRRDLERQETKVGGALAEMKDQQKQIADLTQRLSLMEHLAAANDRMASLIIEPIHAQLAEAARHAVNAITPAVLELQPGPHVVIDNILPQATYDQLIAALPPPEFLTGGGNQTKLDWRVFSDAIMPTATRVIWESFEEQIVTHVLMPALVELFAPVLEAHYVQVLGADFAAEAARLPKRANGRIMLRRPGFRQGAHVDPKRSAITGILYLARPGDNPEYGTQLYSV